MLAQSSPCPQSASVFVSLVSEGLSDQLFERASPVNGTLTRPPVSYKAKCLLNVSTLVQYLKRLALITLVQSTSNKDMSKTSSSEGLHLFIRLTRCESRSPRIGEWPDLRSFHCSYTSLYCLPAEVTHHSCGVTTALILLEHIVS